MTTTFPKFTIKEMLEAGVHFGHKEMLWNPKMEPFLYGSRNGVHIIDLQKTVALLFKALQVLKAAGSNKRSKILFVGTKRQASDIVKEAAISCNQYYVNHRWLGGMLTNWKTVSKSIKRLEELEAILEEEKNPETVPKYNKKELLDIDRKRQKIESYLGGIRKMGGKPDLIFMIDTNKEKIAIQEAAMLDIPVIAVVDSNSSLEGVDFPIPGNDDATRSIKFYCKVAAEAILAGAHEAEVKSGAEQEVGTLSASLKEEKSDKKDVKKKESVLKVKKESSSEDKKESEKSVVKKSESKKTSDKKEEEKETKSVAKKTVAKKEEKKDSKPVAKKSTVAKADTKKTVKKETKSSKK
ncbi:MAG: 30S ribosomal protein S2 [Alphaproteobacteria bacterium]|nr:30S ribosomal protein S2 [Alphaproteobacteria bacterium]